MDGGYQKMPGGGGPGRPGGNDVHVSVGAGIGLGREVVVGQQAIGPSTVYETDTFVRPMNKTPFIACFGVVALFVVYLVMASVPSNVQINATIHHWSFEVHTQAFAEVHLGNWQRLIPYDSYNRMCSIRQSGTHRRAIGQTCHDQQTTSNSRQCTTANGVQHCTIVSTPVVQNVCQTVYQYFIDYDTWCDYNVNRWVDQTPAVASGLGLAPYWPYAYISNCGMLGCTRLSHTEQHYFVDFQIQGGSMATCDFSDPQWQIPQPQMYWGWIQDGAQYQAQATSFGRVLTCNTVQTPQAAPPPPDFQFTPQGGNSSDVLPQPPPHMTTAAPGPEYAPGGQAGPTPGPAPSPPPAFLAAEPPEITELDVAEMTEGEVTQ